jgi:hypothetical protein
MELLMIDLRDVLSIKDLIHEFFGRLLELLDESGVLIFIISPGFEKIVLIEMVFCHKMK